MSEILTVAMREGVQVDSRIVKGLVVREGEQGRVVGLMQDPDALAHAVAEYLAGVSKPKLEEEVERLRRTIKAHESTIELLKMHIAELQAKAEGR